MLGVDGYTIREASNGREGVEMALAEQPDLVLVDLSMPGLDGWGVLRELRADPRTRATTCIAVSAFADSARAQALSLGFDAYLTKPFRNKDLMETVGRFLKLKREARGQRV
jgi:CheY-like chemotaxis protein